MASKAARREYQSLLLRAKIKNPEYASILRVNSLRLEDVQRDLPGDATLISYFVSANRTHAWVIDRQDAQYVSLPMTPVQWRRVACWAGAFGATSVRIRGMEAASGHCADGIATSEEAFDLLIAPLRPHIRNQRLLLVPHGVLHYVPFAALRDPKKRRYLVEDYTLAYLPSASVMPFLCAKESRMDGGVLVIGDPTPARGRLNGAKAEAVAIARAFKTKAKTGSKATKVLLYQLNGKVDLVHIGAHALFDAANPMFSRIELADGNLEVHEILASLDLSGVNLVVLSTCESGVGARSRGDEIVGLTRAVLYAGSPGVISTLWAIEDEASAELMADFYRHLRAGESAGDALRNAQCSMLKREPYGDPSFWAAFTLTGDPQGRW